MDYEKKYKEALEKARQLCVYPTSKPFISDLQDLFPELKEPENEDEKIRKELIDIVAKSPITFAFEDKEKVLAWLDKQGEQNPIMAKSPQLGEQKPADKVEPKFHEDDWIVQENIGIYKVIEICESWYEVVDNKDKHYSIGFDKEYMCHLWTLQDAKDGDVLVASDGSIFIFKGTIDCACKHYVALTTDGAVKFNEGLEHYWETVFAVHPATKEQRDTLERAMADVGWEFDFEKKELKCLITNGGDFESENCEQKSNNKVEPKFKVGDWVVYNHNPNFFPKRIIQITNKEYVFVDGSFKIKTLEIDWHLWTIADAKNGDMLAEDSCIFIVKKMNPNGTAIVSCCLFDDGDFDLGSTLSFDVNSTYPATKEQRDLLFSKMKEAGYKWDAGKKELKKISQRMISAEAKEAMYGNPAWSEEDERLFSEIILRCKKYGHQEQIDWLKSIKQRMKDKL